MKQEKKDRWEKSTIGMVLVRFAMGPTVMGVCEREGHCSLLSLLRKGPKFSPAFLLDWEVKRRRESSRVP